MPDYGLIGEIMFISFGFGDARRLAGKMAATVRLCSEQLSARSYGMRAVKTVITAGGNLEGDNPDEEEEVLLVLTSGNSAVSSKSTGGAARLLEVSRGISTDGLPRMLVSNQPECAAGCPSTPWDGFKSPFKVKLVKMDDRRGDMECDAACDVSACQFDKGDCELF